MKIVEIAPWEEPVPPPRYGGTELVISHITEGLVSRGHEVYLIASGNSKTKATLIPITEKSFRELYPADTHSDQDVEELRSYWRFSKAIEAVNLARALKPDIVHNHISWRGVLLSSFLACPIITTAHGPITVSREIITFKNHPEGNYVSISNNQRKALPEAHWVKTIYNGIDVASFPYSEKPGDYFLFLGRVSPEKGLLEICKLIKETPYTLKIAAKVDAYDSDYFEKVRPYIDGVRIQFVGEVGYEEKRKLLAGARALLLWLNWEEPFGLVVAEALASGTPVVVNARGSMPELIRDGVTGFLVTTLAEMKQRLKSVENIDRRQCRREAEQRFDVESMVSEYEKLMEAIVKNKNYDL